MKHGLCVVNLMCVCWETISLNEFWKRKVSNWIVPTATKNNKETTTNSNRNYWNDLWSSIVFAYIV